VSPLNLFRGRKTIADISIGQLDVMDDSSAIHILWNSFKRMGISDVLSHKDVLDRALGRASNALSLHTRGHRELGSGDIERLTECVAPVCQLLSLDRPPLCYRASEFLWNMGDARALPEMLSLFHEVNKPGFPLGKSPYSDIAAHIIRYFRFVPDPSEAEELLQFYERAIELQKRDFNDYIDSSGKWMVYLTEVLAQMATITGDSRFARALLEMGWTSLGERRIALAGHALDYARNCLVNFFREGPPFSVEFVAGFTTDELWRIDWLFNEHCDGARALEFWDVILANVDRFPFTSEDWSKCCYATGMALYYIEFPYAQRRQAWDDARAITNRCEQADLFFQKSIEYAQEWTSGDRIIPNPCLKILQRD
jgi:hypothetical protein